MSRLYDAYKTSAKAEQEGVWVPLAGARFKLARMGGANLKYQRALTAATRPHMREIQLGQADEKALEAIMLTVFIETILIDWENVEEPGVEPNELGEVPMVPCNKDTARKLFTDLPDLYVQLREQAQQFANYLASSVELAAKNS